MAPMAAYPEMISKISPRMKWFSVLDISNGFWSLPLAPELQCRTAVTWGGGGEDRGVQYAWTVLRQRYKDCPAIFHAHMKQYLRNFPRPDRLIQDVDDILTQSPMEDEYK